MPLGQEEWESIPSVIPDGQAIVNFLREHPSEAYSIGEIVSEFTPSDEGSLAHSMGTLYYGSIVDYLVMEEKIEERQLEEEDEEGETRYISYYRAK